MRNLIFGTAGVVILCVSIGCNHKLYRGGSAGQGQPTQGGSLFQSTGRIDPDLNYDDLSDCYAPDVKWVYENDRARSLTARVCRIQVEKDLANHSGQDYSCNFDTDRILDGSQPASHPDSPSDMPVVFNLDTGDHIYFENPKSEYSSGARFRVRRFVRLNKGHNATGCPKNPFLHPTDEIGDRFASSVNTLAPILGVEDKLTNGCEYKFEIQLETEQPRGEAKSDDYPLDPHSKKRLRCFDPHIILRSGGNGP